MALISMTATLAYGIHQMEAIGQELEAVNSGLLPLSKVSVELGALVSQLDRDHDRFARPGSANDAARKANATLYRKSIKDALTAAYPAPTEIQSKSWPVAVTGRDLVAVAKTGSGKTLGFILPILHRLSSAADSLGTNAVPSFSSRRMKRVREGDFCAGLLRHCTV